MSGLALLFGLAVVASADVGSGIILTHLLGKVFAYPLEWWVYGLGVFFALAPDVDIILQQLTRGKIDSKHREITHYPMIVIPVGILAAGSLGLLSSSPLFWATLAASCLFLHFVHDSIGEANRWGIKWLAPFSANQYQLFMGKKLGGPSQLFCVLTPDELARLEIFSPKSSKAWISTYYLRPTGEFIASLLWLVAAVSIAFLW